MRREPSATASKCKWKSKIETQAKAEADAEAEQRQQRRLTSAGRGSWLVILADDDDGVDDVYSADEDDDVVMRVPWLTSCAPSLGWLLLLFVCPSVGLSACLASCWLLRSDWLVKVQIHQRIHAPYIEAGHHRLRFLHVHLSHAIFALPLDLLFVALAA